LAISWPCTPWSSVTSATGLSDTAAAAKNPATKNAIGGSKEATISERLRNQTPMVWRQIIQIERSEVIIYLLTMC